MNQVNQGNNSYASLAIPVKRKRGRPRKDKSLKRVEISRVPVPPGFERVNGNRPFQVDPIDANDGLAGQAVTGVVEAAFDAGFLIAVKIGNSNTSLRGVVFKPGNYAPVTAENDVAPHLQMIRRNEIHLPSDQTRAHSHNLQSRERNEPANQVHRLAPQTGKLVPWKGKSGSTVAAPPVHPVGARGTVVPVVLQPVNLSNGFPPASQVASAASQAAHVMALKGKHVQTVAPLLTVYPPNGSTLTDPVLAMASQTSPQVTPKIVKIENGPFDQGTPELRQGEDAKSMKSTDVLAAGEVIKGFLNSSQLSEMHIGNSKSTSCKSSVEYSGSIAPEQEVGDIHEPLSIEPLQTVRSDLRNQSASVSKTVETSRIGRMTELLLALQENAAEKQVSRVEHPATGSKI